ncbi:MAG: endonuclease/exonuclease/phosphatase family protein [Clostridia bacterium]|nr:endonuclease/exonuclease/phosphatase family protein [Clostridia bacterium]
MKQRILSLLLVLAMLTLSVAALLPVAAAEPEPEEIQNFSFQASANFAVAHPKTEIRFVFTIGSLDYTKVGFVFSFESYGKNPEPEVGADGCYVIEATNVYSAITADGKTMPAPNGRWWVAGKITNIPQDEFCGWIYIRAFVTDGSGTRYSDVEKTNPYAINRADGEKVQEAIGINSTDSNAKLEDKRNIYTDVLQSGAKTFCPTQENPTGNDLYVEYSYLLNKSAKRLKNSNDPYVVTSIGKNDLSKGGKPLCYWSPCDNVSRSSCKTAGGFEDPGNFATVAASDPGLFPNMIPPYGGDSSVFANYPHIGGSVPLDCNDIENGCEVGWHRIGIVYHEEVTNEAALRADGTPGATPAEYYLTVSLYLDGTLVSVLCANDNVDAEHGNYDMKLYTAESDGKGGIIYTDVASETDQYLYVYRMKYRGNSDDSGKAAYTVFADAYATCGKNFVQTVEPVEYPATSYYRADDTKSIFAPLYYRIVTDENLSPLLSVMSYNIEVYDSGWDGRDPEKVAETILSESPDIVGLQEVNQKNANGWDDTLNALASSGGYTRLQGGYTGRYDFEKNEILYKTARFTKLAEGTKTFRSTAAELGVPNDEDADPDISNIDRIFHYAVLQEKSSGKNILVVNTHLHYGGTGSGHEEDDKLRRYEIAALLAWLETQRATYPDQIVLGDMNSHYKGGQGKVNMKLFEDDGFEKTCTGATVKNDVGGTSVRSARSVREEWIFDYILTKGNLDAAYYTVVDNPIDTDGKYPSDHVPVLAKIYLR